MSCGRTRLIGWAEIKTQGEMIANTKIIYFDWMIRIRIEKWIEVISLIALNAKRCFVELFRYKSQPLYLIFFFFFEDLKPTTLQYNNKMVEFSDISETLVKVSFDYILLL